MILWSLTSGTFLENPGAELVLETRVAQGPWPFQVDLRAKSLGGGTVLWALPTQSSSLCQGSGGLQGGFNCCCSGNFLLGLCRMPGIYRCNLGTESGDRKRKRLSGAGVGAVSECGQSMDMCGGEGGYESGRV